jgi:hypothetical protein
MEYQFTCSCGKRIRVKEEQVGHSGFCKSCGKPIIMSPDVLVPIGEAVRIDGSADKPDTGTSSGHHELHRAAGPQPNKPGQVSSPLDEASTRAHDATGERKTMGIIERYLRVVFAFSRVVSAVFILLCLLIMAGAAQYWLFAGPERISIPEFSALIAMNEQTDDQTKAATYSSIEQRREIERRFGDDIQSIVSENGLPVEAYDIFNANLVEMDESYRSTYVKGLRRFLKEAQDYIKKEGSAAQMTIVEAANAYSEIFDQVIVANEEEQLAAQARRLGAFTVAGVALAVMILFMIIPVLLQIEQNTRER